MTTPTDPTTLRTALEAWLYEHAGNGHTINAYADIREAALGTIRRVAYLRCANDQSTHNLLTPAPAADEARAEVCVVCGLHRVLCTYYDRHLFQPAPTPAPPTPPATEERVTHGRHCRCTPCRREDWTNPNLAHCGMHGPSCPPVYAPIDLTPPATEPVAALVEALAHDLTSWVPVELKGAIRARLDAIVAAARAEGLDGLTVAMVADAIHPEGQGPTIDCCMGSTVESLYPPDEAARLHRKHHEEAATRFLAYLAARRRLPRAPR